ncbi:MAG: folate-binding protein [Corynebacterium sp.]|nr:folate-binding protein [Corynebacterium sp.]
MADTSPIWISPLLATPGAQAVPDDLAAPPYEGLAWHYGDPLGEQRAPVQVVDRSNRAVLRITGEERESFLTLLVTQVIAPGATSALNLDAHGHVVDIFDVAVTEDAVYLIVSPTDAQAAAEYLTSMIFWSQVEITRVDSDVAVVSVITPGTAPSPLTHPEVVFTRVTDSRIDYGIHRDHLCAFIDAVQAEQGAILAGMMAFEAYRIAQVEPERWLDVDDTTLIHESRFWLTHSLDLHKGCYRGQETVSKVENVGRSPRVKALAHLDGSAPTLPSRGDTITSPAASNPTKPVGTVHTVADHHMLGPIALVSVQRSSIENPLQVADCALALDPKTLPPAGEGGGAKLIAEYRAQVRG